MSTQPTRYLIGAGTMFGCDPEIFFVRRGSKTGKLYTVGAEKIIPPEGLVVEGYPKQIVLDGVQAELNPSAQWCRANLGNSIQSSFLKLRKKLAEKPGLEVSFSSVVKVTRKELETLSPEARLFGCAPSLNWYDQKFGARPRKLANPNKYLKRSAGGHLHFGLNGTGSKPSPLFMERERIVPMLDIILGNTCVIIDRDPFARERRKNYGRAGEYRLPTHGLEYRTLSNFWLRSYQLFGLVTGLGRLAIDIVHTALRMEAVPQSYPPGTYANVEPDLLAAVDMKDIQRAIDRNDAELAWSNWRKVKPILQGLSLSNYSYGLCQNFFPQFEWWMKDVEEHGLEKWFPEDPLKHWCEKKEGHGTGWESFLTSTIALSFLKEDEAREIRA